jgi:hypothetical protein
MILRSPPQSALSLEAAEEKALVLKCLMSYLAGKDNSAIEHIAKEAGGGEQTQANIRSFMRLNAGPDALRVGYNLFRGPSLKYLAQRAISLPPEMRTLAAALSDQDEDTLEMPFFLNPVGIAGVLEALHLSHENFYSSYQGAWHIYRYSSDGKHPNIVNRNFLNFKPRLKANQSTGDAPRFSMYFREGRNRGAVGKIVGSVFPLAERVTFLGWRWSTFNQYLFSMVWPIDRGVLEEGVRVEDSFGLTLMPNATGDHVASYVYAKRIAPSADWASNYEDERDKEIELVKSTRFDLSSKDGKDALEREIGVDAREMLEGYDQGHRVLSIS